MRRSICSLDEEEPGRCGEERDDAMAFMKGKMCTTDGVRGVLCSFDMSGKRLASAACCVAIVL